MTVIKPLALVGLENLMLLLNTKVPHWEIPAPQHQGLHNGSAGGHVHLRLKSSLALEVGSNF